MLNNLLILPGINLTVQGGSVGVVVVVVDDTDEVVVGCVVVVEVVINDTDEVVVGCVVVVVGCVVVVVGTKSKFAVTVKFSFKVTMQESVPEQPSPVQPVKIEPEAAVAVSVTPVILVYASLQSLPQFILPSELVTKPVPVPDFEMTKSANDPDCPERTART